MTTTTHAIRQLEKAGATITKTDTRNYVAQMPAARVEIIDQDGTAISIYVTKNGCKDELISDYFAGHFCKNVKQAIALAQRMETWNKPTMNQTADIITTKPSRYALIDE